MRAGILPLLSLLYLGCISSNALAAQWRGNVGLEYSAFLKSPLEATQHDGYLSFAAEPEFYQDWNDGKQSITVTPFYRWDQHDTRRTHGDIRELHWLYLADRFEVSAGISKVFWGVTESQHLVDVINQTDLVENLDGEDKLGQPMVSAKWLRDWLSLEFYLLPYFRERTFPGQEGRPRSVPYVDTKADALYESSAKEKHVDWSVRGKSSFHGWDLGVYYFKGTNRDPSFVAGTNALGEPVLRPFYSLMDQAGLDLQSSIGPWLWKLEGLYRNDDLSRDFFAATGGFEYTFYAVVRQIDAGFVMEYLYDDRGNNPLTPFENDVMVGLRLTPNDAQSTEFLLSVIKDVDSDSAVYRLEASRRLAQFKVSLDGGFFHSSKSDDFVYAYRRDNYMRLSLAHYF